MQSAQKRALSERLQAARAKGSHYFARRIRSADRLARLAYNSTVIEGRQVSQSRLRESACSLLRDRRS